MELRKYTADDYFAFERGRHYPQQSAGEHLYYTKPNGMWVSVKGEDDWPSWCRSEGFNLEGLQYAWRVHVRQPSGMLHLESALDIDNFTERFGRRFGGLMMREPPPSIDWMAVAREYPGIVIAPYVWERRLYHRTSWYYGWDCASGCIWDLDVIESIERIEEVEVAEAND